MTEQDKWIDYAATMYKRTKTTLEKTLTYAPEDKEIISVFEQACSFDRGERAGQQRIDERKAKEQSQEQPPTEKQLKYIEDLGGDPDSVATKKAAGELIEKLRNK